MNRLLDLLPDLHQALHNAVAPIPAADRSQAEAAIGPYTAAIRRKCSFLALHTSLLSGIDWAQLDTVGRMCEKDGERRALIVPLQDARIALHHPTAVKDHVHMAFDGLIAGAVNITDTLGRLINICYRLGVQERRCSLLSAGLCCAPSSPLGSILQNSAKMEWFRKVRELRGRCQHADVEEVLISPEGAYGRSHEPRVRAEYAWSSMTGNVPISFYSNAVLASLEELMVGCTGAIIANPGGAT